MKKKIIGLAVTAALALTAIGGVSSASASNFVAPYGGGSTWTGAREGANHVVGFTGDSAIACSNVSFSGLTKESEPEPTSLTVSPEISGCTFLGQPAAFEMGGCKYRFNFGPGKYPVGTMDIVGCQTSIRFVYGSGAFLCEHTIGNQNGLGPVTYAKSSEGSATIITAAAEINNITFTRTGSGCLGKNGTFSNGTYKGTWKIKGEKLPLAITGTSATEKSNYIFGLQGNGAVSCKKHTLTGQTSAPIFASMSITPSYSECIFLGQPATVNTGGCSYVLHASGGFDIVGSLCNSQPITISVTAGGPYACTVTIPSKSGASGLTYTKGESGGVSTITTGGKATGLTSTVSGPGCITTGTLAAEYKSMDTYSVPGGLSVE